VLARENRLRSASDIARVYKRGAYGGSGGALSVKAVKSGRAVTRAVVVVGKKVSKKAVVRNRIRRRLLELLRPQVTTAAAGWDIVLSVHSDISELPASEISEHVTRALARAGVLTKV
jgi:ribonuclease P protein component